MLIQSNDRSNIIWQLSLAILDQDKNTRMLFKVNKLLYVWNLFSQKIVQVLERLKRLDFIYILNLEAVLLSSLPIHVDSIG